MIKVTNMKRKTDLEHKSKVLSTVITTSGVVQTCIDKIFEIRHASELK